nr:hypothetical protein CFP56_07421 [Quercus suber]
MRHVSGSTAKKTRRRRSAVWYCTHTGRPCLGMLIDFWPEDLLSRDEDGTSGMEDDALPCRCWTITAGPGEAFVLDGPAEDTTPAWIKKLDGERSKCVHHALTRRGTSVPAKAVCPHRQGRRRHLDHVEYRRSTAFEATNRSHAMKDIQCSPSGLVAEERQGQARPATVTRDRSAGERRLVYWTLRRANHRSAIIHGTIEEGFPACPPLLSRRPPGCGYDGGRYVQDSISTVHTELCWKDEGAQAQDRHASLTPRCMAHRDLQAAPSITPPSRHSSTKPPSNRITGSCGCPVSYVEST